MAAFLSANGWSQIETSDPPPKVPNHSLAACSCCSGTNAKTLLIRFSIDVSIEVHRLVFCHSVFCDQVGSPTERLLSHSTSPRLR
jgi:hypothetical protein